MVGKSGSSVVGFPISSEESQYEVTIVLYYTLWGVLRLYFPFFFSSSFPQSYNNAKKALDDNNVITSTPVQSSFIETPTLVHMHYDGVLYETTPERRAGKAAP